MINKESIRAKVSQAIKQMPSIGTIYRENINKYNERVGFNKIAEIEGVFYSVESSVKDEISTSEEGQLFPLRNKNFLTVYDEFSSKAKQGDIIKVENEFFKINDIGENMQIYCLMKLTQYQSLYSIEEYILENDIVHEITEYGDEFYGKFS